MTEIINKNLTLQEEEKELIEEYSKLEKERTSLKAVISSQARINQIEERQDKILKRRYEIKSDLLGESEETRKIKN